MTTLAHISDVHLAPLPAIRPGELVGKRLTGYVNWRIKRRRTLGGAGLAALVAHLRAQAPDFIAVTGDLVNLALDAEFERAADWLRTLGPEEKVCVVPGNHDAYVKDGLERARRFWGGYMAGETLGDEPFPFVRQVGDIAIVGCSSAIATGPWIAAGHFDAPQAERLGRWLAVLGEAGLFRVVLIHHPPNVEARNARVGLWGAERFRRAIAEMGAELVLHGHTHRSSIHTLAGPNGEVPVVGVAAASAAQNLRGEEDPARYNLFRVEKLSAGWSCTMREYGFQRLGSEIVMRLQMRIY